MLYVRSEVDKWACDTLRENHGGMVVIQNDIRKFQTLDEIQAVCPFKT